MNITLIQPFTGGHDIEPPQSLACISSYLDRAGFKVRLIDLQQCKIREKWEEIYKSEKTDLVGLTSMTPQVIDTHDIARRVKELTPQVPVVLGGAHPTLLPGQTLEEFEHFDVLVLGEGEETALELVTRLKDGKPMCDSSVRGIAYKKDGKKVITGPRPRINNLDTLPNHHGYYDFDFYLKYNTYLFLPKSACLIVSRGCPYDCSFCATRNFWTNRYFHKSTDAVIEEIRNVMRKGAENIKFRDSTFNVNKKWVHEFCDKVIKQKLRFKWSANARVNLVDYDLFKHMKEAGLDSIFFGVESGSQRMLDFYGKGITVEQTEKAFEVCHKLKIRTGAYFMLGALPETREEMELTYNLAMKIKPTQSFVFLFMPLPGSDLYQYYIDQGFKFNYSQIRSDKAIFSSAGYTLDELEAMRSKWYHDFNRQPSIVVRAVNSAAGIRSLSDLKVFWRKISYRLPGGRVQQG